MGLVGLRGLATGKLREASARLGVRCEGGGGWRGGGAAVAAHAEIRPPSARPPPVSAASAPPNTTDWPSCSLSRPGDFFARPR